MTTVGVSISDLHITDDADRFPRSGACFTRVAIEFVVGTVPKTYL